MFQKEKQEKTSHNYSRAQAWIQKFIKRGGGLRRKILKEKCLFLHVSSRVHIKTNMQLFLSSSFSRVLSSIYCYLLLVSLIFKIWKGGCNSRNTHWRDEFRLTIWKIFSVPGNYITKAYWAHFRREKNIYFSRMNAKLSRINAKLFVYTCDRGMFLIYQ